MFDERHLQLTSSYAKIDEYFIRNAIYPLAKFIYDYLERQLDDAINKQLHCEISQDTYAMSRDGNGDWQWLKFDPTANEFVKTPPFEQEQVAQLVAESLVEGVSIPSSVPKPDQQSTITQGLKIQTEQETFIVNFDNGNVRFYMIDEETNQIVTANSLLQELQQDIDKYLAECLATFLSPNNTEAKTENTEHLIPPLLPFIPFTPEELETLELETESTISLLPTPPEHIDFNHWQELVKGSAIAPEIAQLNFESLHINPIEQEHQAWEYLMYSQNLERLNTGRLSTGMLHRYSHIEAGGWWCNSGVDPRCFADLQPGQDPDQKLWGCYKPNYPRESLDKPGKVVKYEHPPKVDLSIFLLEVPNDIANTVYSQSGVNPSECDRSSGFWYCVWKHNVPVTITEGAKKAACLLSQGYAAIGLPGIYAGYRSKDSQPQLHDELAVFTTPNRQIQFCFDYDTRLNTKRNIDIATYRTGQLLEEAGAKVSVVTLPGPDKGVDDLVVAQGTEVFHSLAAQAVPLEEWHTNNQPPDLRFTITLKDGTVKTLYEQKNGTVTVKPEIFPQQLHDEVELQYESEVTYLQLSTCYLQRESSSSNQVQSPSSTITVPAADHQEQQLLTNTTVKAESPEPEPTGLFRQNRRKSSLVNAPTESEISGWARTADVTVYKPTSKRRQLEAQENEAIAGAAFALVKQYGVKEKDNPDKLVYRADAFIIKKDGENYTIYRRHNEQQLMTFHADQCGKVRQVQPSQNQPILPRGC